MVDLQKNEITFFGKITAGATHEMKNVLAIINESSGLIEDLMAMAPEASPYHERYQKALTTIKAQVKRGVELTTRLNHFAHSPDSTIKQIDLNEITEQIIELSQRFARLKNVVLKTSPPTPPEQPFHLVTNPVQLQMALFAGIECWLSLASPGNQINIYPLKKENGCTFIMECKGNFNEKNKLADRLLTTEKWSLLQNIISGLAGKIELDETTSRLQMLFPSLKPADESAG